MFEFINNSLNLSVLKIYFPLGVIGLIRWCIWAIKRSVALAYAPRRDPAESIKKMNGFTLSVVTAVYNEDPEIFRAALKSWAANNPNEIIAVIDYKDAPSIDEFQRFSNEFKNSKLIITTTPGKRPALADGITSSRYEIVALVDSDTMWSKNFRARALYPFGNPEVGGIATRQEVLKPDTLARKLFNIQLSNRYFNEYPFLAKVGDALTCISGRTALYRRTAIAGLVDDLVNEKFLGVSCISGDDKALTNLIQSREWKVRYLQDAVVYTPGAPDLLTFFKQQVRWSRNSWRSDLKTLFSKWVWRREKILGLYIVDRFIQPFVLLLGPIYFALSIYLGHFVIAGVLFTWWIASRAIRIYPHLRRHPEDMFIMPAYVLNTYFLALIKFYSFFTMNHQGWITRWDKGPPDQWRVKSFRLAPVSYSGYSLRALPAYVATALIVVAMVSVVTVYKEQIFAGNAERFIPAKYSKADVRIALVRYQDKISDENIEERRQEILSTLENNKLISYSAEKGDTLFKIAAKYNSDPATLARVNVGNLPNANYIYEKQKIIIPVSELSLAPSEILLNQRPEVTFSAQGNTITLRGEGSATTIRGIYDALADKTLLMPLDNNEWMLKANLLVGKGVSLVINGNEVSWLKIKSDENGFVWVKSENGNIQIAGTAISSWDETNELPDINLIDGRSYIFFKDNGRMDIRDSEIAFLGYAGDDKAEFYGLGWKISAGTLGDNLATGSVLNSKIHDNYFGIYTSGATGMIIESNEIFKNVGGGIVLRDLSNNLSVRNNHISYNGNNGLILANGSFNNTFMNNSFSGNQLHGVIAYGNSNNNFISSNAIMGNDTGLVVYDSYLNLIENNNIGENKSGLSIYSNSARNFLAGNDIKDNEIGVSLYDGAKDNLIKDGVILGNGTELSIKNSAANLIINSMVGCPTEKEIKLGDAAAGNFIFDSDCI